MRTSFCRSLIIALGLMGPLYYTYKSLEANDTVQKTIWIKYWAGMGVYLIADSVVAQVSRGPMSELVDCARIFVLIWIQVKVPETFYDRFVGPTLRNWRPHIDEIIKNFFHTR
nr:receptor expression-enhancing protein 3-like [Dermacentor andersoni]